MQTYEFPAALEKSLKGSTGEIYRWLSSFKELQTEMAAKLIFLARYYDSIPEDLRANYVETLVSALEAVPNDFSIKTSADLKDKLSAFIQSLEREPERRRLKEVLERHLVEG